MNNNVNSRKNAARSERLQQRAEAGTLTEHFPEVAGIVVSMTYNQKGIAKPLPRIVNFFPGSYALFKIDCLNKDCADGGFDLTQVITAMIRTRRKESEGEISCEGDGPSAGHSSIVYKIAMQFR